jgi:type I restriction enzyme S subunit
MRSPSYLKKAPIDTTPGQLPRIRLEEVAAVEINLPSLENQQRIAAMLKERMASAEQARQAVQAQLDGINQLPGALLRQAFKGEV